MEYKVLPINQDNLELLNNTDRGFRLETYLDVHNGKGIYQYADTLAIDAFANELTRYQEDQAKLTQIYFYLTEYKERALDQTAFDHMEAFMMFLQEKGIKAILRLAYVWDDQNVQSQEPTTQQIVEHLHQLEPFFYKWASQIHVLQAGIIGAWGEWAIKARDRADETTILNTLLAVTPSAMKLQVRYTDIKVKNIDIRDQISWNRVGYHDDFLIGQPHRWNTSGQLEWSRNYQFCLEDSKQQLIDGEMIWWWANPIYVFDDIIDPKLMAQRLNEGSFTSLSLAHNYRDMDDTRGFSEEIWKHEFRRVGKEEDDFVYHDKDHYYLYSSMNKWKEMEITASMLHSFDLPYQESWFTDCTRNWYEYFRDYLGYRIECTDFKIEKLTTGLYKCEVGFVNHGFSAPNGLDSLRIAAVDASGEILSYSDEVISLQELQTNTEVQRTVSFSVRNTATVADFGIILWDKAHSGNRLANDCRFVNGINLFDKI